MKPTSRSTRWYRTWYEDQKRVQMSSEDWIYIGLLVASSIWAFSLGLLIGWVWLLFI